MFGRKFLSFTSKDGTAFIVNRDQVLGVHYDPSLRTAVINCGEAQYRFAGVTPEQWETLKRRFGAK